jgi:hypothetical protein
MASPHSAGAGTSGSRSFHQGSIMTLIAFRSSIAR